MAASTKDKATPDFTKLPRGKRDPKNAPALLMTTYHEVASETYPDVDYSGDYSGWAQTMDGNDKAGCCVPCGTVNTRRLDSAVLDGVPAVYTIDTIWQLYKTQNPGFVPGTGPHGYESGDDQGMDLQTLWEWLLKNDVLDRKLVGFVKVDHNSLAELQAGISLGGSLAVGGMVTDTQQREFPGTAWSWDPSGADPGGHCFLLTGHRKADDGTTTFRGVCWASAFDITQAYIDNALDEAWLLIWEDMLESKEFIDQMDVATFAADVSAATGDPFPVAIPTPGPTPTPGPAPTPDPVDPPAPVGVAAPVISEPADGATLDTHRVRVDGEAPLGVKVQLILDGVQVGEVNSDASQGTWWAEGSDRKSVV